MANDMKSQHALFDQKNCPEFSEVGSKALNKSEQMKIRVVMIHEYCLTEILKTV
jgi:hypothetical protein